MMNPTASVEGMLHRADQDDAGAAARALESYFLRQVFAELRKTSDGVLLGGGFAGSTFQEILDGAMADSMAASGGVGLADVLEQGMQSSASTAGGTSAGGPAALPAAAVAGELSMSPLGRSSLPEITTSDFGQRRHPMNGRLSFHTGTDLAAPEGAPVRSAGGGVVSQAGRAGAYGNMVVVDHGDGLETRYAHLSAIGVKSGDRVTAGAIVGQVGATGRATGPHLHIEVRQDGQPLDPAEQILGLKK